MSAETCVALIQLTVTDQKAKNLQKLARAIQEAAAKGARLIVLPELHNTPYFCQREEVRNFDLAEPIPGSSTEYFGKIAKKLSVVLVLSLFEKRATGLYHNTGNRVKEPEPGRNRVRLSQLDIVITDLHGTIHAKF